MAAPTRILSLNLGMQTISMAEFRATPDGGLTLQDYRQTELLADPAAEASRIPQMKIAIKEMVEGMNAKGCRVSYSVPAQSVFTRFVKLPTVDESQIEQVINFEAQQNVPFPINEVVWDYQIVGSGSKMEVLLVAIKSDLLEELNVAVEEAGLKTSMVDVAPMALYNAFRYNYSDVQEPTLLIDIGARTTNLIFVESGKVFTRSIAVGGTAISSAVAKDFNEPFGISEERKRNAGFVSLGGAYEEPADPDVGRVAKVIRNSMTRLHAEISRSIAFYRTQQHGSAPQRVFLCGGSVSLPYMKEFFQEKLQLPIEFFNPLRNVAVTGNVDQGEVSRKAHSIAELVGLGLRSVSNCPMELNLEPASVKKAKKLAVQQPFFIAAGVCLLLCLAGWWLYFVKTASLQREVLEDLNPKVAELQGVKSRFDSVTKEIEAAEEAIEPSVTAINERQYWVNIIDDLNSRLPSRFIWITSFEPVIFGADDKVTPLSVGETKKPTAPETSKQSKKTTAKKDTKKSKDRKDRMGIRVQGLYLEQPSVVDAFMSALNDSPYVEVNRDLPQGQGFKRSVPDNEKWAHTFEIPLYLKTPISLQ